MWQNMHHEIEVASRRAALTGIALALHSQPMTGIYPRWNIDFQFLGLSYPSFAVAMLAWIGNDNTLSLASLTCAHRCKLDAKEAG